METQTDSKTPRKIYAGMLCVVASVILLFRIFVLFLLHFSASRGIIIADGLSLFSLSMAVFGFAVPLFGLLAIIDILTNWRFITNPDYLSKNKSLVRRIACSFLITGLFFAVVSLFIEIFIISVRHIQFVILPILPSIWLIIMALLALVLSFISYKLYSKTSDIILTRVGAIFSIVLGLVAVSVVFIPSSFGDYLIQHYDYSKKIETFSGSSGSLSQTIIVTILDSPFEENKNIVWCSSFQIAWNKIIDDVIGEPVEVVGAEELAARLNSAKQSETDMEPESFYAAAGRIKQGIVEKIYNEMAAKFPSHSVPDFSDIPGLIETPDGILSYSYLTANVPFKYPYSQVDKDFSFTDSNGIKANVAAIGVWGYGRQYRNMREQVEILFCRKDYNEPDRDMQMKEFAVDLCRHSSPYQVVAAIVEPRDSLSETLEYVQSKTVDFKNNSRNKDDVLLDDMDVLIVPEMFWEIDHCFEELLGKVVSNADPPMPIVEARQGIKFRLDRYGATLESEATFAIAAIPRYFRFNRPFLVYMKKRDCEQPFFVMWIDNAELLSKK